MYEDYGNGNDLLWANTIIVDVPNVIEFKGHLSPQFGGPSMSFLRIVLATSGSGTTLSLSDGVLGPIGPNTGEQLISGWKILFEQSFKRYVESR